jgi:hypothetical protein
LFNLKFPQKFEPNEDALMTLLEFGYHRDDVIYALRIYSNNVELASSYLISNPNPVTEPQGSNRHNRIRRRDLFH